LTVSYYSHNNGQPTTQHAPRKNKALGAGYAASVAP
jgi:hypothetical protein